MAITILARDESALGIWQLDYDSVAKTVGHTCTTTSPTATLTITVTRVSNQQTFTKDVTADFGKGRVVDVSNVQPSEVPPHVKGTPYPFLFGGTWTP